SKNLVLGKLRIDKKKWITTNKLAEAVDRIYGSQYFEKVTYKLEPVQNGVNLFIRVVEKSSSNLNFGFHYDDDADASVLINATLRNKLIMGSKLSMSVELSENYAYDISYFIHTGLKPGFGFGFTSRGMEFKVPIYHEYEKVAIFDYSTEIGNFDVQTIFSNSFTLGGGLELKMTKLTVDIVNQSIFGEYEEGSYDLFSYRGYCCVNTYDKVTYPNKGIKLWAEAKRTYEATNSSNEELHDPISTYFFRCTAIDKFIKNIVYEETVYLGSIKGKFIPSDGYFYLGSNYEPEDNLIPFVGHKFMSIICTEIAILASSLRWEVMNDLFLTVKGNWAFVSELKDGSVIKERSHYGYCASFGLMTPIGPLEMTASQGNDEDETLYSVSIGYYF
ncbi:hypothetical protein ACFLYJ_01705, partial [Candidatus Cloacimonadota bacterium]